MSEHGTAGAEAGAPASGLARFADSCEKALEPVYRWIGYLGGLALFVLVVGIVYSVVVRVFGSSFKGVRELSAYFLLIVVSLVLGAEHLGHEKMTVDILAKRFPRRVQDVIATVMYVLAVIILVIATWKMVSFGTLKYHDGLVSTSLSVPAYPFIYLAAFGLATLVPIYIIRLLHAIARLVSR